MFIDVLNACSETMWKTICSSSPVNEEVSSDLTLNASSIKRFPSVHHDAVTCVATVAPNICLSGSKDKNLVLFDYGSGRELSRWTGHEKEITKVLYGQSSDSMYSCSRDKTICIWKQNENEPRKQLIGHDLVITGLSINQENTHLVSGSRDNTVRMWDLSTGQCVNQNEISRNLISHVHWADGSNLIAQTGEDKETRIFDSRSLQVTHTFQRKQHIQTWCDISNDNQYCVTSSNGFDGNGCEATLWDLRNPQNVSEFKGHTETCGSCLFIPTVVCQHRKIIATCGNDCCVKLWDQRTRECLTSLTLPGSGPLTSLSICEDGSLCVSSFNTGVYVLQITTPSPETVCLKEKAQF